MALAFLCQKVVKDDLRRMSPPNNTQDNPKTLASLSAFIVDHKMRKNSSFEAHQVAAELTRLGIEPHVLELDWKTRGDPSQLTNVETAARTLRYQALGRACRDRDINTLLFAHHADDQHETVLSRIYSRYLGIGLRGMEVRSNIPECAGIHGVDRSGRLDATRECHDATIDEHGRLLIESGGVTIGRPLLPVGKDELVKICQENDVKWFEDHTNMDPTLTIRNTFRHLIGKQQLPLALSKQRLSEMSAKISEEYDEAEAAALRLFREMPLILDLRSGAASLTVKDSLRSHAVADSKVSAMLLRKMLEIVSGKTTISLQVIGPTVDSVFSQEISSHRPKTIQIAGVEISEDLSEGSRHPSKRIFTFRRAVPTKREQVELQLWPISQESLVRNCSEWILWDGRYWIQVWPPEYDRDRDLQINLKFLSAKDLQSLRCALSTGQKQTLNDRLCIAKGSGRFTLPAIVARKRGNGLDAEAVDRIVALPTVDWSVDGWQSYAGGQDPNVWLWDIRYKHVNLDLRGVHRIVSYSS